MRNNFIWICFLTWSLVLVGARPADNPQGTSVAVPARDQVISVRITSSVAVSRTQLRSRNLDRRHKQPVTPKYIPVTEDIYNENQDSAEDFLSFQNENETQYTDIEPTTYGTETPLVEPSTEIITMSPSTDITRLSGANFEFIKQLNARKGISSKLDHDRSFNTAVDSYYPDEIEDSAAEASAKSEIADDIDKDTGNDDNVPLARSIQYPVSSDNYLQGFSRRRQFGKRRNDPKVTTVGFNVDHDMSGKSNVNNDDYTKPAVNTPAAPLVPKSNINTNLSELPKIYNEPAKIYSQPAKFYSEPAKFYSEPAKIYSEPAKIYGEPSKVYGEPAKIYSEPAKFYSHPASLHLPPGVSSVPWQNLTPPPSFHSGSTELSAIVTTTPVSSNQRPDPQPEKNYEVDETESVMTDGRSHGVQEDSKEKCKQENCKVGYVVEGRQYKKYQVEEKTSDGFIVGEYGVVRNEDGALRGVRYTADSDVSPRLIYDTLMKFLQLK